MISVKYTLCDVQRINEEDNGLPRESSIRPGPPSGLGTLPSAGDSGQE